jgi:hypothetical protein
MCGKTLADLLDISCDTRIALEPKREFNELGLLLRKRLLVLWGAWDGTCHARRQTGQNRAGRAEADQMCGHRERRAASVRSFGAKRAGGQP